MSVTITKSFCYWRDSWHVKQLETRRLPMERRVTAVNLGRGVMTPKGEIGGNFLKLLTAKVVADQLNVSLRTVRRLIAQKKLATVHIGTAVRIRPETLASLIGEQ